MLKGEHPTKKWQNFGTEVLCVMLIYDGAELTRIVNKVLGEHSSLLDQSLVNNHERITEPVKLQFFCFNRVRFRTNTEVARYRYCRLPSEFFH